MDNLLETCFNIFLRDVGHPSVQNYRHFLSNVQNSTNKSSEEFGHKCSHTIWLHNKNCNNNCTKKSQLTLSTFEYNSFATIYSTYALMLV